MKPKTKPFIGRNAELAALKTLLKKETASLLIVKGRRRIGKSRLLEEFATAFPKSYIFSGLPPEKAGAPDAQRQEFLHQYERYFHRLPKKIADWSQLFFALSQKAKRGRVLIVLDEIT